jgi:hypothetical protein
MENSIGRLRLLLAAGVVVALLPLSVAEAAGTYECQYKLKQSQLKSFEKFCDQRRQARAHCWVDTSQVPNYFTCCCVL